MGTAITFGAVETRIRRDLVNDNDSDQYRWSAATVLARINETVVNVATRYNPWAGYDQDTGAVLGSVDATAIRTACDTAPGGTQPTAGQIAQFRAMTMPIDGRWADAVAYLTAAKLLETDDSDTENAQRSAIFQQKGMEMATR